MIRLMGLVTTPAIGDKPVGATNEASPNKSVANEAGEKWIQKAIKKPGSLKKQMGVPAGEKIPAGKLAAAAKKGGKLGKRARLAQTLRKLKEDTKNSPETIAKLHARRDFLAKSKAAKEAPASSKASALAAASDAREKYAHAQKAAALTKGTKPKKGTKLTELLQDDTDAHNDSEHHEDETNMARAQLMNIKKCADHLFNMIGDGEALEPWVQNKIGKASDYINTVYHYMDYEKNKHSTAGDGEKAPADKPESNI